MKLEIENICNIEKASLEIQEGKLNVKYGYNGIGKTSISRAIQSKINLDFDKNLLVPFDKKEVEPTVKLINEFEIKNLMVFDQNYLHTCIFLENNDALHGTYNLIVKSQDFDKKFNDINRKLFAITDLCSKGEILKFKNEIEKSLKEIAFTKDKSPDIRSRAFKGLKKGDEIFKAIPPELKNYEKYINSEFNYSWIDWIKQGSDFIIDQKECPFCLTPLDQSTKEKIEKIKVLDSKILKDNFTSKKILNDISCYCPNPKLFIEESDPGNWRNDKSTYLFDTYIRLKTEVGKIGFLAHLDAFSIKAFLKEDLKTKITGLKIDEVYFNFLPNDLKEEFKNLNEQLDDLIKNLESLKKDVGDFNSILAKEIKQAENYLNGFLKISGIPYEIQVKGDNSSNFQTILVPEKDTEKIIEKPKESLSYGEMNALSLVLFSIEVKAQNSTFIILDDPISSFDSNKKYAIIDYLFLEKDAYFKERSVLIITHDFSTVLTLVKLHSKANVFPTFLINSNGNVSERILKRDMLENTLNIETKFSKNKNISIIARIGHLRKVFELSGEYNFEYDILSSLMHLRSEIKNKNGDKLEEDDVKKGIENLKKYIENFDYKETLEKFKNSDFLIKEYKKAKSSYSKLFITRAFIENKREKEKKESISNLQESKILWNFICDAYHIENLFVFGIADEEYNEIPNYIIDLCDRILFEEETKVTHQNK